MKRCAVCRKIRLRKNMYSAKVCKACALEVQQEIDRGFLDAKLPPMGDAEFRRMTEKWEEEA